jgi:nucleotide-binding universal stress UspA family protein
LGRIVVGVDESAGAAAALRWAVREADVRGWSLTAVAAWTYLDQRHANAGEPFDPAYGEADAAAALDAIVARTLGASCGSSIDQRVVNDHAAPALLEASDGADLVVVGARGLGRLQRLLLGSVSSAVLRHATCPVTIVRDGDDPSDRRISRVVVGVDGSDTAARALDWALEEGRLHGASVEVVHAWSVPYASSEKFAAVAFDSTPLHDAARRTLDAAIESADTDGLAAPVVRTLTVGSPAACILEAAAGADLVVVGSRGLGGFKGLVLGSVSYHIVHHATCPVVVVPPAAHRRHAEGTGDIEIADEAAASEVNEAS